MDDKIRQQLAPTGVLRAGINLSNFLLVTGKAENGDPVGVSPDMAKAVADRIGVPLKLIPYPNPGEVADAGERGEWDIGNIGAEPQRAQKITFTDAYCEIEATYLVPAGSTLQSVDEVDRPGMRIATTARAAFGLWLQRNIKHAELVLKDTMDEAFDAFVADKLDALAAIKPRLLADVERLPGARVLDGRFSAVQQAIGTPKQNVEAATWLASFVEEAKASGLVARLIEKHEVKGLSVAPPAGATG